MSGATTWSAAAEDLARRGGRDTLIAETQAAKRKAWLESDKGTAVITAMKAWKGFWGGPEGKAARKLLSAAGAITFGHSPEGDSGVMFYITKLTANGLEVIRQSDDTFSFGPQNAGLETDIQWFFQGGITPENFLATVRERLDQLAARIASKK